MKHSILFSCALSLCILSLSLHTRVCATSFGGGGEATIAADIKHEVNFFGRVTTHQATAYDVDNISIDNKYRHIQVVDKPDTQMLNKAVKNEKKHKNEIMLSADPYKEYVITLLDLNEIKEIHAIPDMIYVYKDSDKARAIELIEIQVLSNAAKQTKHSYLIDAHAKIYCNELDSAGPIEKTIPISAIKTIRIDGHAYRHKDSTPPAKTK